jgi:predicted transcriptional regulator
MPVADTSKEAYHKAIKGKTETFQDEIVFQAVCKYGPCTSQKIASITGMAITSVTRSVNNLHTGKFNSGIARIKKDYKDKCGITQFNAWHYSIPKQEIKVPLGDLAQGELSF